MRLSISTLAAIAALALVSPSSARELSLAYFMAPSHPMNAAVFTPFAEKLAEVSGGELTVQQYPGGALNSVPPRQYSILLDGIADIVFTLPGYTGDVFPMTNVITLPDVCASPTECTEALLRARDLLETEYDAKVLAIWTNAPPVLITRDKPVRSLEDLAGMKIRVTSKQDIPFIEALGAAAIVQPVSEINQNLTNGVIDAIAIDTSAIGPFKLHEAGRHITTWLPGSGAAFILLMSKAVYDDLSEQERGWVDEASGDWLSLSGSAGFEAATTRGLELAKKSGLEIIDLSDEEKARWQAAVDPVLERVKTEPAGSMTVGEVMAVMKGN